MPKRKREEETKSTPWEFNIKPLPWDNYQAGRSNILIGPKGSGKSWTVRDVLTNFPFNFDFPICYFGTMGAVDDMEKLFPRECIIPIEQITPEHLALMQEKMNQIKASRAKQGKRPYNFLLYLDDCSFNKQMFSWKEWKNFAYQGRHYRVTIFITCQDPMDLPPNLRANFDYIFVKRYKQVRTVDKIYDLFFSGVIDNKDQFLQIYHKATEGYGALVIDNVTKAKEMSEQIFYYDSPPADKTDYAIGNVGLWYLHWKRFKMDDDKVDFSKIRDKNSFYERVRKLSNKEQEPKAPTTEELEQKQKEAKARRDCLKVLKEERTRLF